MTKEKSITGGEVEALRKEIDHHLRYGKFYPHGVPLEFSEGAEWAIDHIASTGRIRGEWRPISEAPRDGTEIIVLQTSGAVQRVKYVDDDVFEGWVDFQEEDSYWSEEYFVRWMLPPAAPGESG